MKGKVAAAWDAFRWFCATQAQNFYVGIVLSALSFLALSSGLPILATAAICPFLTAAIYILLRLVTGGSLKWKGEYGLKNSLLATTLSSAYLLFLVSI